MIIIEREAVLCLVNREGCPDQPSPDVPLPEILSESSLKISSSSLSSSLDDDRIGDREPCSKTGLATSSPSSTPSVILSGTSPISCPFSPVECLPYSTEEFSDDDEVSCATISTSSSTLSSDRRLTRVSWCTPLVTEVWTRPRTRTEDLGDLFYTYEETQRFRQEYRQERKMLAQLQSDPSTVSTTYPEPSSPSNSFSFSSAPGRHRISRVVVMHNDTLKTFFDDDILSPKTPSLPKPEESIPTTSSPALLPCGKSDDFFDDDSFWSGSITWY